MVKNALVIAALCACISVAQAAADRPLTAESINAAQWSAGKQGEAGAQNRAVILKAQVLLGRAGFSPGVIDARDGDNFRNALKSYQGQNDIEPTGKLDEPTWGKLAGISSVPVVTTYVITSKDVQGPFTGAIPKDYEKMAELDRLGFHSPRERIAEKFHMDEDLLVSVNKGADFAQPDTNIIVANVAGVDGKSSTKQTANVGSRDDASGKSRSKPERKGDIRVEVNKSKGFVRVLGENGRQVAFYPATVGSEEKPAPSGTLEVRGVAENPTYRYNPDFKFKGQKAREAVTIAPGPNSPVGTVWIALSADSYGIHGTAHPEKIGKTESHGCVRLTNWDALALAKIVKKGTQVEFVE